MKLKILLTILFIGCLLIVFRYNEIITEKNTKRYTGTKKTLSERYLFSAKRIQFIYDMLKDPATGKIPEGIKELELQTALSIPKKNDINNFGTLGGFSFTSRGPSNLGGRTRTLVFDRSDETNNTLLAGGVSSGVFRTTDEGANWIRVSPPNDIHSVTSIAQDPTDKKIWYYATGEAFGTSQALFGTGVFAGHGIWKSVDRGLSWNRLPTSNTSLVEDFDDCSDMISRIIVHPATGDVYAAKLGAVMRSQDKGATWTDVLGTSCSNTSNFTDIKMTPSGDRIYAAFSGRLSSTIDGVWTSTTGNTGSWTRISGNGSPSGWNNTGGYGRIVLDIAPSAPNLVYALYYNNTFNTSCATAQPTADLFMWNQLSGTWTDKSANLPALGTCNPGVSPFEAQRGYNLVIAVKPDDPNVVFVGGTTLERSNNAFTSAAATARIGGYNITNDAAVYPNHHPDIHDLVFHPDNPNRLYTGTDGGIHVTDNNLAATVSWTSLNNNYQTFQYYYAALHPEFANAQIIGGTQDNGTAVSTGGTVHNPIFGGDGVAVGLGAGNPNTQYVGVQNGRVFRRLSNLGLNTYNEEITPAGINQKLFVTYFYLDPDNSSFIYYPDDTGLFRHRNAPSATSDIGAAANQWNDMTGVRTASPFGTIRSMASTRGPYNSSTASLFIGTGFGTVFRLDDPANTPAETVPVNITPPGMAAVGNIVSSIAVNPGNDDTVLVTYSNYNLRSIWFTGNANSNSPTWQLIEGNLDLPAVLSSAIAVTPSGVEFLVGTTVGLYSTTAPNGASTFWMQESPNTVGYSWCKSLALRPSDNKLLIGTHGNGMFEADLNDVTPIELAYFRGKLFNGVVELEWKTVAEATNKEFEVMRTYNPDDNFTKIGTVISKGNGSGSDYQFTDFEFDKTEERAFYRLKQIDLNNDIRFSTIVSVNNNFTPDTEDLITAINPNPFIDELFIRFNDPTAKSTPPYSVQIIDMTGKTVFKDNFSKRMIILKPANLAKGVYILLATDAEDRIQTAKLVKQ